MFDIMQSFHRISLLIENMNKADTTLLKREMKILFENVSNTLQVSQINNEIRTRLENEYEALSSELFIEANRLINEAEIQQQKAEKEKAILLNQLKEKETMIESLQLMIREPEIPEIEKNDFFLFLQILLTKKSLFEKIKEAMNTKFMKDILIHEIEPLLLFENLKSILGDIVNLTLNMKRVNDHKNCWSCELHGSVYSITYSGNIKFICDECSQRVYAACQFFNYVHYLGQSEFDAPWKTISKLRIQMLLAKTGSKINL